MEVSEVLRRVLMKIGLSEKEMERMNSGISEFVGKLNKNIKKRKIKAEVFVGGSSGKGTVVKRKKQDIDIFVRFANFRDKISDSARKSKDFRQDKKISEQLGKILEGLNKKKIHGSRDYFKVKFRGLGFEVVPVLKISSPEQAKNITDLSYFHVSYINNKLKENRGLGGEIMLAKSFAYAQDCYGAESYIRGFSGYSLELLVINYGGFLKMIREMSKVNVKRKKLIIDLERHYKGKRVEEEMNESKLSSPVIFIDPTFKQRNVLAGLSYETFHKFQNSCKKFLYKPDEKFFFLQPVKKEKFNLILKARTGRQEGDIAGSKLWKFYNLTSKNLEKYFIVGKKEFDYDDKKSALLLFKTKQKKQIIIEGPPIVAVENVVKFKKKHKKVFVKKGKVYAKEKSVNIRKFLSDLKKKNKKIMRDMGITGLGID